MVGSGGGEMGSVLVQVGGGIKMVVIYVIVSGYDFGFSVLAFACEHHRSIPGTETGLTQKSQKEIWKKRKKHL